MSEKKNKYYLIEYEVRYNNKKVLGRDDVFSGEGVFYLFAKNNKEARVKAYQKIRTKFKGLHIQITRVEVSYPKWVI